MVAELTAQRSLRALRSHYCRPHLHAKSHMLALAGALYGHGAVSGTKSKVHSGDVVTFRYNAATGEVECDVNSSQQGICFRLAPRTPIWPCVAFYGTSPTVSVVKCEAMPDGAGADDIALQDTDLGSAIAVTPTAAFGCVFDENGGSLGAALTFSDCGATVTSNAPGRSLAVAACGFSVRATWTFCITSESLDDEQTCIGAVVKPVKSFEYDCGQHFMYRCYNASLYGPGKSTASDRPKIHEDSVVQIEYDSAEGTLTYAIDGAAPILCFTGVFNKTLYPAVGFYGSGRSVTLLDAACVSSISTEASEKTVGVAAAGPPEETCGFLRYDPYAAASVFEQLHAGTGVGAGLSVGGGSGAVDDVSVTCSGTTASSVTAAPSMVVVNKTFGRTFALWEVRIDQDTPLHESLSVGAVLAGATSPSCEARTSLQLRGSDGVLFGENACTASAGAHKFTQGDVVAFLFDGIAGTLSACINASAWFVTHTGLAEATLQPACCFFAKECTVTLLRCMELPERPVEAGSTRWLYSAAAAVGVHVGYSSPARSLQVTPHLHQVKSLESDNQMAVFDYAITNGRHVVEFRLDAEQLFNEGCCIGFVANPSSSMLRSYESPNALMAQALNGRLYAPLHLKSSIISHVTKLHPGDVVRFHIDMTAGTVDMFVNNRWEGDVFTNIRAVTLFPAAVTYLANRAVSLLRSCAVDAFPASPSPHSLATTLADSRVVRFHASRSGPPGVLTFAEGGTVVTSTNSTNAIATATVGFGNECAVFEFVVSHDILSNEGLAFGICTSSPPLSFDYSTTSDQPGCFYRCFNGTSMSSHSQP